MKRYSWIAALLVVALAFVLFGCGGEAPYFEKPEYETNVLMITFVENWSGLDITGAYDGDGDPVKGGIKFKKGDQVQMTGTMLIPPDELYLAAPRIDWYQVGDIDSDQTLPTSGSKSAGKTQKVYQAKAGDKFDVTVDLIQLDEDTLKDDGAFTNQYNATTAYNLRLKGNTAGASIILEELVYLVGGVFEKLVLSELIADLEPGVIEDDDAFKEISKLLLPAGTVGEHVKFEIIGP